MIPKVYNPQEGPVPNAPLAVSPAPVDTAQPAAQPQASSAPSFVSKDQAKLMVQTAQSQGLDPATLMQTLVKNGYIIEGLNDQQYQYQQIAQGSTTKTNEPQQSWLGKVGSFIGGAAKSMAQPFVSAVGSGLRSLQATPQLFSGDFAGAQQTMQTPILGEKTFAGMNNKELIGSAAKAGSFLAGAVPGGAVVQGLVGGGLFGGGEAAQHNASGNEIIGGAVLGAAGGAVAGKVFSKLNGYFKGGGASEEAVNAYNKIVKDVTGNDSSLGQKFIEDAAHFTKTNPNATLQLNLKQVQVLEDLAARKGVQIPEGITTNNLNPSQTQELLKELNSYYNHADPANEVTVFARQIKKAADTSFGEPWKKIYSDYSSGINVVRRIGNMLEHGNNVTPEEANASLRSFGKLANDPLGKIQLKTALEDYAKVTGTDLSDPTKLIAKANKVKNPVVKKAIFGALKLGAGALGLHEFNKLIP